MADTYCIDYDDYLADDNDDDEEDGDNGWWWYQTTMIMVMSFLSTMGENVHWNLSNLDVIQIQLH